MVDRDPACPVAGRGARAVITDPQTVASALAPVRDVIRDVMITLITLAAIWTARMVFKLRDTTRDLCTELYGRNNTNGVKTMVAEHQRRLTLIEGRNTGLDAVAAAQRDLYEGEERRHNQRRFGDEIRDAINPTKRDP
jgi:hypothetical protein